MKFRQIPRELLLMTLAMIIANTAAFMYIPLFPLYLGTLGASIQQVGLFFTLQVIMALCFRILGGWISDQTGRLWSMAVAGVLGLGAFVIFTVAPTWEWAIVGGLLEVMGSSLVGPSFQAYTAEKAPEGGMSSTFGLVNGLFLICLIIGPLLGGYLVQEYGYKTMFGIATGIYGLATVMRIWMARREQFDLEQLRKLKASVLGNDVRALVVTITTGGLLLWLFIADGMIDAAGQLALPFVPKYATEIGGITEATYGILFAFMSLIGALTMLVGGVFADRFGERWGIALGAWMFGGAWLIMIFSSAPYIDKLPVLVMNNPQPQALMTASLTLRTHQSYAFMMMPAIVTFMVAFGFAGVGQAFVQPALSSLVSKSVPKESLGITWGVFMTALGALAIPAPLIGGIVYDRISPETTFILSAVSVMLAGPVAIWKLRLPRKSTPDDNGLASEGRPIDASDGSTMAL